MVEIATSSSRRSRHHHQNQQQQRASLSLKIAHLKSLMIFLSGFWVGAMFTGIGRSVERGETDSLDMLSGFKAALIGHRAAQVPCEPCKPCDCSSSGKIKNLETDNTEDEDADSSDVNIGKKLPALLVKPKDNETILPEETYSNTNAQNGLFFPETMSRFAHGMGSCPRRNFVLKFDAGVPIDPAIDGNKEVLILYGSHKALPYRQRGGTNLTYPEKYDSVKEATENCDLVKVMYTDPKTKTPVNHYQGDHRQCIAIVGQWEVPHVHKFRKSRTGRFAYEQSHHRPGVPSRANTAASNEALQLYLKVFPEALERLRPIAERAEQKNQIVVMVSNKGQFHFFVNFWCSAAARRLDTSRVLLFATDEETFEAATTLGVNVFYDRDIFQSIPKGAAVDYHDVDYGRIMMSKVYSVHMVNALGYDLLFQDLDLVWYSDPFKYFKKRGTSFYDIYIQHDGLHHPDRFQPLAANTGFYYVKHSALTEYFFSVFVRNGDLVLDDKSHQAAFTVLAKEHMSLRGLRIKVLSGAEFNYFLSGYHLHSLPKIMKLTRKGIHKPVMFHANWLAGAEKLPAMKETRNWYVNETICNPEDSHVVWSSKCCMAKAFKPAK